MTQSTTNWDSYYQKPYKTAKFSRKITGKRLIHLIKEYTAGKREISISELGGANSCFYELIKTEIKPITYNIYDNNEIGLKAFEKRISDKSVKLHNIDLLNDDIPEGKSDVVFSIGLIEHFDPKGTSKIIQKHFDIVKENGIIIISYPTPTFLYKITRFIAEKLGLWIFHDERPLQIEEVLKTSKKYGSLLKSSIIWPIFLTQEILIIKPHK